MSEDVTVVRVGPDISRALRQIKEAGGPIKVRVSSQSCRGGSVFDLIALSGAMAECPHKATAVVCDTVPVAAIIEADDIIVMRGAVVYVGPLQASTYGDKEEQKAVADALVDLSGIISDGLAKWPKIQELFNACESHYLTGDDFKRLTKTKGENNG